MRRTVLAFALFLVSSMMAIGQDSHGPMTNSDVLYMVKSGLGEQTIVLAIKQGNAKFDTSPQSLIELKKAGVGESVLNAMIATMGSKEGISKTTLGENDAEAIFHQAISFLGSREVLAALRTTHSKTSEIRAFQGRTATFDWEYYRVFPESVYTRSQVSGVAPYVQVISPFLNYERNGDTDYMLFGDDLESRRLGIKLNFLYVAKHSADYHISFVGDGQVRGIPVKAIKLSIPGTKLEEVWNIDPQSGRVLSTLSKTRSGDALSEYSDFRQVGGLMIPFKQHTEVQGGTSDYTTTQYETNVDVSPSLFDRPNDIPPDQITLRVLQANQIPYTQQIGGGQSSNCNISSSANTLATANTAGNTTWGNGTTNSNMQMNCNSYDTTIRWPHMLNMMLIEASDGNAYIIECDKAWRWSKCGPLIAGQTFNARFTPKGIEVEVVTAKGQSIKPVYGIVQSQTMR